MSHSRVTAALLALAAAGPASAQQTATFAGERSSSSSNVCTNGEVAGFVLRSGDWIDAIQVRCRYPDGNVVALPNRGGEGGTLASFLFEPGERILRVTGYYRQPHIHGIQFHTDRRRTPIFGSVTDQPFTLVVPAGQTLLGLDIHSGQFVNGIGLLLMSPRFEARKPGEASAPQDLAPVALPSAAAPGCPQRTGICRDQNGLQWSSVQGGPLPANALNLGAFRHRLCRAYLGAPGTTPLRHVGTAPREGAAGCTVVFNGIANVANEFEVLVGLPGGQPGEMTEADQGRWLWTHDGTLARGTPLTAAEFNGESQGICIVSILDGAALILGRFKPEPGRCVAMRDPGPFAYESFGVLGSP